MPNRGLAIALAFPLAACATDSPTPTSDPLALHVLAELGPDGTAHLADAWLSEIGADTAASIEGALAVVDDDGNVIATGALPERTAVSIIDPAGETGAAAQRTHELVEIVVPWPAGAVAVTLGADRIEDPPRRGGPGGKADDTAIEPTPVLVSGASAARFDVVILGDGYTSSELGRFADDVDRIVAAFGQREPYRSYAGAINFWRVPLASPRSGAGSDGRPGDTRYGCYYGCSGLPRLLCCRDDGIHDTLSRLPFAPDARLVVVNDVRYGGSGGVTFATTFNGPEAPDVALHEIGHQLGLADEYSYGSSAPYRATPNCAGSASSVPWTSWLPEAAIDAFPVCGPTNHYRPTDNGCLMRTLGFDYCPVCRDHVIATIYRATGGPARDPEPDPDAVRSLGTASATFRITPIDARATVVYRWSLDGAAVGANTPTHTLAACSVDAARDHVLAVRAEDTTPWVRVNRATLATEVRWTVRRDPACD